MVKTRPRLLIVLIIYSGIISTGIFIMAMIRTFVAEAASITSYLILILPVLLILYLLHFMMPSSIEINEDEIIVRKLFGKANRIQLASFDGYIDKIQRWQGGPYKLLYLIKEGVKSLEISELFYSNFDEIQEALGSLKYLGKEYQFKGIK